jgi:hypothetical protein
MSPGLYALVALACAVAISIAFKMLLERIMSPPTPAPKPEQTAASDPYRTGSAKPAAPEQEQVQLSRPTMIVDWQAVQVKADIQYVCPACRTTWLSGCRPKFCTCNECNESHFHMRCGNSGGKSDQGCEFAWIMRSALSKKPAPPKDKPDTAKVEPPKDAAEEKPS